MNKKVVSAIVSLGLVISLNATVLAEPISEQLKVQQQQLQDSKNSLQSVKNKRQELELNVEKLDGQIEKIYSEISNTKKKISKTQEDIKSAEEDIKKTEEDIKAEQEVFNKRMRAMYINGVDGYLDIILESKGIGDFISRVEAVKKIIEFDKKVTGSLKAKKEAIVKQKEALNSENNKLLALKADNEKKLAELNEKKKSVDKLVEEIKKEEATYANKVSEDQALVNETKRQINNMRQSVPKYNPSRGAAAISSNSIVAYGSNFLGTPYQWGGNGPSTFDCSGFVKYVYGHFGVSLPRVASDQQGAGTPVSRSQLQPGDLVFFGYPAHHVGIYVGNDCYMHAPRTGDVVKISSLSGRSDFSGGTRVR